MLTLNEDFFGDDVVVFDNAKVYSSPETKKIMTPEDNGVSFFISQAIQDTLTTIDQYNSLLISIPDGYDEVKEVINKIIVEENKHIGSLQAVLDDIDINAAARKEGEAEVKCTLNNAVRSIM